MAKILRYNLEDFKNITFDGFLITLPEETLQKISEIALQVGSPTYVRTPVFNKKEHVVTELQANPAYKKRRNRPNLEASEDWETIRTFQATKFEQKEGLEAVINNVRLNLNKLTDKNYDDLKVKIIELIPEDNSEEIIQIGTIIFLLIDFIQRYMRTYIVS